MKFLSASNRSNESPTIISALPMDHYYRDNQTFTNEIIDLHTGR